MQFARRSRASIFTRDFNAPGRRSATTIPSSPVGCCAYAHHPWINGTPGSLCQHPAFSAGAGRNRNRDAGGFGVGAGTLRLLLLRPPIWRRHLFRRRLAQRKAFPPVRRQNLLTKQRTSAGGEVVPRIGRITRSLNVRSLGRKLPRIFECVDCLHIFVAPDRFDSRKAQRESTRMARARLD